jgi:hypothetical protein
VFVVREEQWYLINHARNEYRIVRAFNLLRSHGIEPILIKGWAIAIKYPALKRAYTDIDLCVDPKDFQKAKALLKESDVDLHEGLRHLDLTPWEDLFANSRLIETEKGKIRVLRDEDHLRVLCIHWLTNGGADKERLLDIYYTVKNRSVDFDWERFLGKDENRRGWLECVVGLTSVYYGLELKGTPFEGVAERIPKWVFRALEREWGLEIRWVPLHICLRRKDIKEFFKQVRRRIPPNPLQAMVEVEGKLTDKRLIVAFYQFKSFLLRFWGFLSRVLKDISDAFRKGYG